MKVVVVNEGPLYPPNGGARIRTLNLLLRLAGRHEITCICRASADARETLESHEYLQASGIRCITVDSPIQPKHGVGFYASLAGSFVRGEPYSVSAHNCPAMRRAIVEHAARNPVDLWQFEWIAYADALNGDTRRLVIAHDVVSMLWQRRYEFATPGVKRWFIGQQWRKIQSYESRILRHASHLVAVSDADARTFRERFGASDVDVVDNGVDYEHFAMQPAVSRDPNQILFLGNLESGPNRDAAMLMLREVFPAVRRIVPDAKLMIAGKNPPSELIAHVSHTNGVEIHANVPDVRPLLACSGVMAVPIRIGSGSRLKILESLAAGLPVVSTRTGAEGLRLRDGQEIRVVDEIRDLPEALFEAMRHPEQMRQMTERGRAVVREQYDWSVLADRLERVWVKCVYGVHPQPAKAL